MEEDEKVDCKYCYGSGQVFGRETEGVEPGLRCPKCNGVGYFWQSAIDQLHS